MRLVWLYLHRQSQETIPLGRLTVVKRQRKSMLEKKVGRDLEAVTSVITEECVEMRRRVVLLRKRRLFVMLKLIVRSPPSFLLFFSFSYSLLASTFAIVLSVCERNMIGSLPFGPSFSLFGRSFQPLLGRLPFLVLPILGFYFFV